MASLRFFTEGDGATKYSDIDGIRTIRKIGIAYEVLSEIAKIIVFFCEHKIRICDILIHYWTRRFGC